MTKTVPQVGRLRAPRPYIPAAALLLCLASCQPAGAYVVADRAIYDAIAPAHRRYLIEDSGISPASKELRLQTLEQWRKLLESAEAASSRPSR